MIVTFLHIKYCTGIRPRQTQTEKRTGVTYLKCDSSAQCVWISIFHSRMNLMVVFVSFID